MNLILRMIRKALRTSVIASEAVERSIKSNACVLSAGAMLHSGSRVWNLQDKRAAISIGEDSVILGQLIVFPHGGSIRLGKACHVGEGSRIWSAASIEIGDRVQIAHGVNIHDTNSHSLSASARHMHFSEIMSTGHPKSLEDVAASPIIIEDDVWIGFNSIILKGVRIGKGAVVAAGTVVTKDVAPYTVVAGNPARVVGASKP